MGARISRISHVIGIDDAAFAREERGDVPLAGVVCSGDRVEGFLVGKARRDGADATREVAAMITGSRFVRHLQLVMLEGIAVAGFNVIDVPALAELVGIPVLIVCRIQPDLGAIRRALLRHVRGGLKKWHVVEAAPPLEKAGRLWIQRAGLSFHEAESVLFATVRHGNLPEPVRLAHLCASGLTGYSLRARSRGKPA